MVFRMFQASKKVVTERAAVEHILSRAVEEVFVRESLEKKLLSGKKLRIKFGIDPTSPKIHLGRAVLLRKLRDFQKMGHTVVFIVGDFTAQIGDPSDKIDKRPMLTRADIKNNLKGYLDQAGKIIDLSSTEVHYNAKWLDKLGFQKISELAESFSVQQMSARRNFSERFEKGEEVSLREFLYPLMQGYDSVAVRADVEIGGSDQLFNMKAGRIIQKHYGQVEQDVITVQMLEGTDGRKMSSSWGNVITLVDELADMYGKLMAVRDDLIIKYMLLCTDLSAAEIEKIEKGLVDNSVHPKEAKMRLAREIVTLYHGANAALKAQAAFVGTFSKGEIPEDIQEIKTAASEKISDILVREKVVASKSEWTRLVKEGAITLMEKDEKVTDPHISAVSATLRIGKRRFVKLIVG